MTCSNGNGNGNLIAAGVTDFVFPGLKLEDSDYMSLKMRLDLYDDAILATRYAGGTPGPTFAVDPDDLAVSLAGLSLGTGLLPANCLFWSKSAGVERIGVYLPPRVWPVSVVGQKETWRVPLPGLVFSGKGGTYQIFAVRKRPDSPHDPLFVAPVPNMSHNICTGSAEFPAASADTIMDAVKAFFGSAFNRHLSNNKSRKHKDCVVEMWAELNEAGARKYPPDDLIGTNITVGRWMKGDD